VGVLFVFSFICKKFYGGEGFSLRMEVFGGNFKGDGLFVGGTFHGGIPFEGANWAKTRQIFVA
jgi:hypothetical protein